MFIIPKLWKEGMPDTVPEREVVSYPRHRFYCGLTKKLETINTVIPYVITAKELLDEDLGTTCIEN